MTGDKVERKWTRTYGRFKGDKPYKKRTASKGKRRLEKQDIAEREHDMEEKV